LSLAVFGGHLIVGGRFDSLAGQSARNIAAWDGSSWHSLGPGLWQSDDSNSRVEALLTFQDDLIVTGYFDTTDNLSPRCIARWDGYQWSAIGSGLTSEAWCEGTELAAYHNQLIAVRQESFDCAEGWCTASILTQWNGSEWSDVDTTSGFVRDIQTFGDALVASREMLQLGCFPPGRPVTP